MIPKQKERKEVNSLISPSLQLEATSGRWHRKGKTNQPANLTELNRDQSSEKLKPLQFVWHWSEDGGMQTNGSRDMYRSRSESLTEQHSAPAIPRERTIIRELAISLTIPKDYTELRGVQIPTSQSA